VLRSAEVRCFHWCFSGAESSVVVKSGLGHQVHEDIHIFVSLSARPPRCGGVHFLLGLQVLRLKSGASQVMASQRLTPPFRRAKADATSSTVVDCRRLYSNGTFL